MKILIDNKIPFIRSVLEPWAEVLYLPAEAITAAEVRKADALVVRTRTRCDSALLAGSRVRMIATATIGYDHIDTDYCAQHGIRVATAAGCNARGVAQWVFAALGALEFDSRHGILGIVGVGNVGGVVRDLALGAGVQVICCDPPRVARQEAGTKDFVSLETLLNQADAVTLHIPLNAETTGLASTDFFAHLKPGGLFLNSSRGEVVNEPALLHALRTGQVARTALDVWQGEPAIDRALLEAVTVATPHIAGYTLQGKAMATALSVRAMATHFGWPIALDWYPPEAPKQTPRTDLGWTELSTRYPIWEDDRALRRDLGHNPLAFEALRSNYRFRPEFF